MSLLLRPKSIVVTSSLTLNSNSQGRGAVRKLIFKKKSTNILSSVVGLAACGKRKFDSDSGGGGGGGKKRKGGGD